MGRAIIGAPPVPLIMAAGGKMFSEQRTRNSGWKIEQKRIDMARGRELGGEDGMNRALARWNDAGEVRITMIEIRSILQMDA